MHMSDKYLYTATDTSAMGQYWLKISANQYLGQALNSPLTYRARVTASLLPSRLERGPEILNNRKKNNKNNRISLCSLSHHSFPFDPFHTSGVWMKIISGWNEKLTTYSLPQSLSSSIHIPSCYRKKTNLLQQTNSSSLNFSALFGAPTYNHTSAHKSSLAPLLIIKSPQFLFLNWKECTPIHTLTYQQFCYCCGRSGNITSDHAMRKSLSKTTPSVTHNPLTSPLLPYFSLFWFPTLIPLSRFKISCLPLRV